MDLSQKKGRTVFMIVWGALIVLIIAAIIAIGLPSGKSETIKEAMKDGVLHEENKVSFFGLLVNPAVVSAYVITGVLLLCAALIRIFAVPRFKDVPGKFQSVLEKLVEFFEDMARGNSPHKTPVVAAYIFSAGVYIFFSTLFELFGIQVIAENGHSIALPAPLSDINAAIAMGFLSYLFILLAGIIVNGVKGGLRVLKDFSLPISMSFRIFGALLSGLLVTELVYYYTALSFVVPVIVGVLFTILHAVIQTYVLATLVSVFYGEAVEPVQSKKDKKQRKE
ncbi:MAG: F0F1 ATP synthase subunit A [Lachnospiraceae bacterium]|nr:F0F1 ATP synthase subunit A [Lachnospiraceae bacterium]